MELLRILEKRVDSMVAEIHLLRNENAKLRQEKSGETTHLAKENSHLKRLLQEEHLSKDATHKSIEKLLSRINDALPNGQ